MSQLSLRPYGLSLPGLPPGSETGATLLSEPEWFDNYHGDEHLFPIMHYRFEIEGEIVDFYTGCTASIQALEPYTPGDVLILGHLNVRPEITILTVRSAA